MRDYLTLGSAPYDEECAQVGSDDYAERSRAECKRYKEQLEKQFPALPDDVYFAVKSFPHDFGTYREVVVCYETDSSEHVNAIVKIENELPAYWLDSNSNTQQAIGEALEAVEDRLNEITAEIELGRNDNAHDLCTTLCDEINTLRAVLARSL